jgi:hypothetical protein
MSYIIILGLLVFFFFIWWVNRPIYYKNVHTNEFEKYVKAFLNQSKTGSLMFIQHESSDRFVQFAKHESKNLKSILNFGFPDAPCSRAYFDNVLVMLQENHINYETMKTEGMVNQFIYVNIASDNEDYAAKTATSLAIKVFKAMGLDEEAHYRISFDATVSADAAIPELEKLASSQNKIIRNLASRSLRNRQKKRKNEIEHPIKY